MTLRSPSLWKALLLGPAWRWVCTLTLACACAAGPVSAQALRAHPMTATLRLASGATTSDRSEASDGWLERLTPPVVQEGLEMLQATLAPADEPPAPAPAPSSYYLPNAGASELRFASVQRWTPDLPPPPPIVPEPAPVPNRVPRFVPPAFVDPSLKNPSPEESAKFDPSLPASLEQPPPRIIPDELRPPVAPEELLYYFERPNLTPSPLLMPESRATYRTQP